MSGILVCPSAQSGTSAALTGGTATSVIPQSLKVTVDLRQLHDSGKTLP